MRRPIVVMAGFVDNCHDAKAVIEDTFPDDLVYGIVTGARNLEGLSPKAIFVTEDAEWHGAYEESMEVLRRTAAKVHCPIFFISELR